MSAKVTVEIGEDRGLVRLLLLGDDLVDAIETFAGRLRNSLKYGEISQCQSDVLFEVREELYKCLEDAGWMDHIVPSAHGGIMLPKKGVCCGND